MSDQEATEAKAAAPAAPADSERKATPNDAAEQSERMFTQTEFDKKMGARLAEEREKFADYDELKARAEAADSAIAERDELQAKVEKAEAENLRARVAADAGVPANLLTGTTEKELTESAQALAEFAESSRGPSGPVVKSVGSDESEASRDDLARAFLGNPQG